MTVDEIDTNENNKIPPTGEIIEVASSSDEEQTDNGEVKERTNRQSVDEQEDGQASTLQTRQEIQDKAKKDEALRLEAEIERKKKYGIKEIDWNEDIDARLYSTASQIYETLLQMQKDSETHGLIRQNQLMFLSMMEKARERVKTGKQAFETREEIITALGSVAVDEMLVCGGKGIKIVLEDQAETEESPDKKPKTRGFGAAARIFGAFRKVGSPTGFPNGVLDGALRTFYKSEIIPEEEENIGISIEEQAEKIIHPYYRKIGESNRWKIGDSQEVIDYIEKTTRLRGDIVRALGLPDIEFDLDALLLRAAAQTDGEIISQQDRIFKELLEGRQISELSNTEIPDLQLEVIDRSVTEYCEDQAIKLLAGEATSGQLYEKEILQIEEQAARLESGKVNQQNVQQQLTEKQEEKTLLDQRIARLEKRIGSDDENDLLVQALSEYREAGIERNKTTVLEASLSGDITSVQGNRDRLVDENGRLSVQLGTVNDQQKNRIRATIVSNKEKIRQLNLNLQELGNKHRTAQQELVAKKERENIERQKIQGYLDEFGQTFEARTGKRKDSFEKRQKLILELKGNSSQLDEGITRLSSKIEGKPTDEDRIKAAKTRMIGQLNQSEMYNTLLGAVDAETILAIGNIRDQHEAHLAIARAAFDNIKITIKNEDGTETEPKLLKEEEMLELLTRGEILHVAMETFGIEIEDRLKETDLKTYKDNLDEIQKLRQGINMLREITNLEESSDSDRIKSIDEKQRKINEVQETMQEMLVNKGFSCILPDLSRDVFATRQFVANSLDYLRAKAARGELYMAPRTLKEAKPTKAVYEVEPVPQSDYGELEIKSRPETNRLGLDYNISNKEGITSKIKIRMLKEPFTAPIAKETGLRSGGEITTSVAIIKDIGLWESLPPNISKYKKGTPLEGWPQGLPLAVMMTAYNKKGIRISAQKFVDGEPLYLVKPISKSDGKEMLDELRKPQLPGEYDNEVNDLVLAQLTKKYLSLSEQEKQQLFGPIDSVVFSSFGMKFDIKPEKGGFQVFGGDLPATGLSFENFIQKLEEMLKAPLIEPKLDEGAVASLEDITADLHTAVGARLFQSLERKFFGR